MSGTTDQDIEYPVTLYLASEEKAMAFVKIVTDQVIRQLQEALDEQGVNLKLTVNWN
ncbi:MAG: hypothetical protein OXS47_05300 [Chloroflexota bacterium]|nr:hypothetical protein [Chloroflexota bacterium]